MSNIINIKSMFDQIKASLSSDKKEGNGNGLYKEILRFSAGNTYLVRLVPNPNSPKETIFHYYNHGWTSNATGKFVTALCPTTFGESCPIDAYYLKTYRTGTESEKESARMLSRKEAWMINAYVISDPENPENEGKVKILRYGKELNKIIESALEGDDAQEFGVEKVFDIKNGATLRIKCESRTNNMRGSNQKMVTYASSKFLAPSVIDDITDAKLEEIYNSIHDLKSVSPITTPAEMQRLLDEHFFNLVTGSPDDDHEINNSSQTEFTPSKQTKTDISIETTLENSVNVSTKDDTLNETDESTDEQLRKLLQDL